MNLIFILLNGEVIKKTVSKSSCIIGRSSSCDLVLALEGISRQHCKLDIEDGNIFITDLGSTNGVLINGEKIPAHTKTPYPTYLPLSFGPVDNLQIEIKD